MTCDHCAVTLRAALAQLPGVHGTKVSFEDRRATLHVDGSFAPGSVVETAAAKGYVANERTRPESPQRSTHEAGERRVRPRRHRLRWRGFRCCPSCIGAGRQSGRRRARNARRHVREHWLRTVQDAHPRRRGRAPRESPTVCRHRLRSPGHRLRCAHEREAEPGRGASPSEVRERPLRGEGRVVRRGTRSIRPAGRRLGRWRGVRRAAIRHRDRYAAPA